MLLDALKNGLPKRELSGLPTRKQRIESGTPLKHYLRPLMEEAIRRQLMQTMAPQLPEGAGPAVEPPSISPLQNALMSVPQGGGGGTPSSTQGGSQPYGS